ncbi:MAG: hypothetical protein ACOYLQ_03900 [Hyphomicrobiaceae bacterium]
MRRHVVSLVAGVATGLLATGASAQPRDPPVPPGLDPGGVPVAVFADGIDYTDPQILRRLARDGEGDLVAWDFTDGDARPHGPSDPRVVALLGLTSSLRLIVARGAAADPARAARLTAFVVRTVARIVVVWDTAPGRPDWTLFLEGVRRFPDRLFVVPAVAGLSYHEVRSYPNLLVAARAGAIADVVFHGLPNDGGADHLAASNAAALAADALADQPRLAAAEIKARLQRQCGSGCRIGVPAQPR